MPAPAIRPVPIWLTRWRRWKGGAGAVVTGTGMGAVHLVTTALLKAGDLLIAPHDCYGGTWRLFEYLAAKGHYRVQFVDQGDEAALAAALAQKPALVWVETPSNPLLRVVDISAIASAAHEAGAQVVVDNTFLSPLLQQPLALGADVVVHSTTKYINGHSDVVGGVAIAKEAAQAESLVWWANCLGLTSGAFDSYLTLRGLRTLAPRLRTHQENTDRILAFLQQQPLVKCIYHPSLPSHPGHDIARRQQSGFGAMLSFELDCSETGIRAFLGGPHPLLGSRVPRRSGESGGPPGQHDPQGHDPGGAAGGRHQRPVAALVGRH